MWCLDRRLALGGTSYSMVQLSIAFCMKYVTRRCKSYQSIPKKSANEFAFLRSRIDQISGETRTLVASFKRLLVGKAKRTEQAIHERLTKSTGLAVFASDALSSTAYASEEILLVLAVAAAAGQIYAYHYIVPISIIIAIVLGIVATSYRQTIHAYPS